jgi:hypothetical protein
MDDVFEAGDKLVSRFAYLGTHLGEFRGVAPPPAFVSSGPA